MSTKQPVTCTCPKTTCNNHCNCADCVIKHKNTDSIPFCLFPDNDGDKSLENFYHKLKERFENKKINGGILMKPIVRDNKCFASQSVCKAIKVCPTNAISYIEVKEPIMEKNLVCNCKPQLDASEGGCGCGSNCGNDVYSCGGTPYGRIVIDYDACIGCGLCAKECCGTAIDMIA